MPKKITIIPPEDGLFDAEREEFIHIKPQTIVLEHSLVSLSKWESKWKIPYLTKDAKTPDQVIDYIKCMTITQNVDPNVYLFLTQENIQDIIAYIQDPMTATTFTNRHPGAGSRISNQVITSELIYYWMISSGIPMNCEKWHLERLMTLIKIFDIENQPKKPMSKSAIYAQNKALNAANRARFKSRG